MIHRYCHSLLLFLLVFTLPILSSHTACPYDLNTASRLIPAICYANATAAADTCCWLIFMTYICATICHANLTSEAFLPTPEASTCASAFFASLIRHGLICAFLLNSSDSCKPFRDFSAGTPPCPYRTVSTIRFDLSNASLACTAFQSDLFANRSACIDCRNTLTIASLDLFNVTKGKEFFSCDMAKTIGIWSLAFPSFGSAPTLPACSNLAWTSAFWSPTTSSPPLHLRRRYYYWSPPLPELSRSPLDPPSPQLPSSPHSSSSPSCSIALGGSDLLWTIQIGGSQSVFRFLPKASMFLPSRSSARRWPTTTTLSFSTRAALAEFI